MLSQARQQGSELRLVLGIGLNLLSKPQGETRVPPIAIKDWLSAVPSPDVVARNILDRLELALASYQDFFELQQAWENRCLHIGKEISYFSPEYPEEKQRAIAVGLGPTGELLVERDGENFSLSSEEVSLELLL
jgi:biotin-(acetyl-CoA carboxylase) ligase